MDIKKIAELASLKLSPEEQALYEKQFDSIIKYVDQIAQVDTKNTEPLVTPVEMTNQLRKDENKSWPHVDEALKQAPSTSGSLYKVPPVL